MWELVGKAAVGIFLTKIVFSILKGLYGSFLASFLGLGTNFSKLGKWAVVTGATDGIGKAYSFELAKKGFNIVLISRSPQKLETVAEEIKSKFGVETQTIDVDFTSNTIYERIDKETSYLDIGILVNNVGMSYDYPDYLTEITDTKIQNLITCNILSVTLMTKLLLPAMIEKKRGLIINVSSYSSIVPAPFLSVYGATKAYMVSFSKGIGLEVESKGVTVKCITPVFVVSNMSKMKRSSLMIPDAQTFVRFSLKTTGIEDCTGGYYMHKLQIYFTEVARDYLPGFILASMVKNQLNALRCKALKKKEREAKQN